MYITIVDFVFSPDVFFFATGFVRKIGDRR